MLGFIHLTTLPVLSDSVANVIARFVGLYSSNPVSQGSVFIGADYAICVAKIYSCNFPTYYRTQSSKTPVFSHCAAKHRKWVFRALYKKVNSYKFSPLNRSPSDVPTDPPPEFFFLYSSRRLLPSSRSFLET